MLSFATSLDFFVRGSLTSWPFLNVPGLPGRVYESGVASWERGVHKAPTDLFERGGGANQWGIQTVLGIPIASASVGRIVVLLYSRLDRPNDSDLVLTIMEELTKVILILCYHLSVFDCDYSLTLQFLSRR